MIGYFCFAKYVTNSNNLILICLLKIYAQKYNSMRPRFFNPIPYGVGESNHTFFKGLK
jgi:hypothetical protein